MSATAHSAAYATSDLAAELRAMLTCVAFAPLQDVGWLRIIGPDAKRWLNGMVTNNVAALKPGEGCYNFLLNAQGRILGDCTIYRDPAPEPAAFLLETGASQIETIQAHLDRFIIMDDVELIGLSAQQAGILIAGPLALNTVHQLGGTPCSIPTLAAAQPTEIELKKTAYRNAPVLLVRAHNPLVQSFEIWAGPKTVSEMSDELSIPIAAPAAIEALRILSGTPRYGVDIRNTDTAHDLPQETAQDRALHFTKGCYLGQEIVERIRSRGSVHRTFAGFILKGDFPPVGTELATESQPRPVGELTSVVAIPQAAFGASDDSSTSSLQLALGYIRREALDRHLPLTYPGGTATPAALPFKLP